MASHYPHARIKLSIASAMATLLALGCGAEFAATATSGDASTDTSITVGAGGYAGTSIADDVVSPPPDVFGGGSVGGGSVGGGSVGGGSVVDAARADVASHDATMDAGRDAAPDVGVCGVTACPPILFECATFVDGNFGGLVISNLFSVAWRFQVPAGRTLTTTKVGIAYRPTTASGTLFAALVALTGPTANPKNTLLPSDVLGSAIYAVPMDGGINPRVISVPLSVALPPGWYAIVFGTDQLGAMGAQGSIVRTSDAMNAKCTNGQNPISLRQTGEVIAQASDPYIFVEAR
jgi:hypothetical protein